MVVKAVVAELAFDPNAHTPIMILKEEKGSRTLPIWIGVAEASAIALQLKIMSDQKVQKPERPLSHDLMKLLIDGFGTKLTKVVIDDLRNNTFFAKLYLENQSQAMSIDARPSDAVALALRCSTPIYVEEKVLESNSTTSVNEKKGNKKSGLGPDDLRDNLRNIDPSEFGKYSLD